MATTVRVTELQRGERVPKAVLLSRLRERTGCAQVPEIALLRDAVYLLQGICGEHVRIRRDWQLPSATDERAPRIEVRLEFDESAGIVSAPTRDVLNRVAELGQLYSRVSQFVDEHRDAQGAPLTTQSLCHFAANELSSYAELIARLETQWARYAERCAADSEAPPDAQEPLMLRGIGHELREPLLRMRLLSTIVERCRVAHGGALISTIHTYTQTGDPFVREFTASLLDRVSRPFFDALARWIFDGELLDPFGEFFIAYAQRETTADADAADVWHHKFELRTELLPSFLSRDFARKIFSTGRSLNFIRSSCGDSDWAAASETLSASGRSLRYSDMAGLEHTIDVVFSTANKRLLDIFLRKFHLLEHLRALRDYLMLMRGDFVDALLASIGPSLGRPASTLYQHNLSAALETAIRASNAQFDNPDVLRRLDARSLEAGAEDSGWDTFTLEYRVESPVSAVLDASAMAGYQMLFHYLWKIKRVEHAVTASWSELTRTNSYMMRVHRRRPVPDALRSRALATLAHISEMVHFVRQLQGFCQLEVIAYSWQSLENYFGSPSIAGDDLDRLIEFHRSYLGTLINKALLRGGRRGHADQLGDEVRAQLDCVLAFCLAAEDLSHHVTAELARLAGGGDAPLPSAARSLSAITARLDSAHARFQQRMLGMIALLERHPNLSVRDLARRWNFNVYYRRPRQEDVHSTPKDD
ncbi:Microtubule-nucleating Tub4p (gamma-tubulin) complex component [Malassezia cuniculi]|uniref:Microtubule-nucleating Tub4p (Gamma-tubulin) complex component n=1 Tax=Malassezia cuniculi TaxID=948313 RepID=A0AAF0EU35_9BASI|nr:Microtubule-nucleating Tub4p (gamma-tubulin) complex component [Malassezia cuniculi]